MDKRFRGRERSPHHDRKRRGSPPRRDRYPDAGEDFHDRKRGRRDMTPPPGPGFFDFGTAGMPGPQAMGPPLAPHPFFPFYGYGMEALMGPPPQPQPEMFRRRSPSPPQLSPSRRRASSLERMGDGPPGRRKARPMDPQLDCCYYCGRPGHFARECEVKMRDVERGWIGNTAQEAQRNAAARGPPTTPPPARAPPSAPRNLPPPVTPPGRPMTPPLPPGAVETYRGRERSRERRHERNGDRDSHRERSRHSERHRERSSEGRRHRSPERDNEGDRQGQPYQQLPPTAPPPHSIATGMAGVTTEQIFAAMLGMGGANPRDPAAANALSNLLAATAHYGAGMGPMLNGAGSASQYLNPLMFQQQAPPPAPTGRGVGGMGGMMGGGEMDLRHSIDQRHAEYNRRGSSRDKRRPEAGNLRGPGPQYPH